MTVIRPQTEPTINRVSLQMKSPVKIRDNKLCSKGAVGNKSPCESKYFSRTDAYQI